MNIIYDMIWYNCRWLAQSSGEFLSQNLDNPLKRRQPSNSYWGLVAVVCILSKNGADACPRRVGYAKLLVYVHSRFFLFSIPYWTCRCCFAMLESINRWHLFAHEHSGSQAKAVILKRHVSHVSSILHFHAHCDSGEPWFTHKTQQIYIGFQLFARHFRIYYNTSQWSWLLSAWIFICLLSNHPATWLSTRIDLAIFCGKHHSKVSIQQKSAPTQDPHGQLRHEGPRFQHSFRRSLAEGEDFGLCIWLILVTKPVGLDDEAGICFPIGNGRYIYIYIHIYPWKNNILLLFWYVTAMWADYAAKGWQIQYLSIPSTHI